MAIEYRSAATNASVDEGKISGLAAPFNNPTTIRDPGGDFRETFAPGAFTKTLQERDVVLLVNHDTSMPIARASSGSLTIRQTENGLEFEATPNNTTYARDLMENIRTGVVNGTSFGFIAVKEDWADAEGNPVTVDQRSADGAYLAVQRTVREAKLFEITAATFPAYEGTSLSARDAIAENREARNVGPAEGAYTNEVDMPPSEAPTVGLESEPATVSDSPDESTIAEHRACLAAIDANLDEACNYFMAAERDSLPAEINQAIDLVTGAAKLIGQLVADKGIPDPDHPNGNTYAEAAEGTSGRSLEMIRMTIRRMELVAKAGK